jgi:hypothetical protein
MSDALKYWESAKAKTPPKGWESKLKMRDEFASKLVELEKLGPPCIAKIKALDSDMDRLIAAFSHVEKICDEYRGRISQSEKILGPKNRDDLLRALVETKRQVTNRIRANSPARQLIRAIANW